MPGVNIAVDYEFWAQQSYWTVEEAAALIADIDPKRYVDVEESMRHYQYDEAGVPRARASLYVKILDSLRRDVESRQSGIKEKNKPPTYLVWVGKRNYKITRKLRDAVFENVELHTKDGKIKKAPPAKVNYCTSDMQLMFDAIEKFWKGYDLSKPNPSIAPLKKDVVTWLRENAEKRGIADFSKSRAEAIDTIIRCPAARTGGNSR